MGVASSRGAKRVTPAPQPPCETPKVAPPAGEALTVMLPPASSVPASDGGKVEVSKAACRSPASTSRENSGSWSSGKREKRPIGRLSFAPEPGNEESDSFKRQERSITFVDDDSDSFRQSRPSNGGGSRSVTPKRVLHDDANSSGSMPRRESRPSGRLTFAEPEPTDASPDGQQGGEQATTPRKQRSLSRSVSWAREPPSTNGGGGGGGGGLSRADSFRSNASNDSFKSSRTCDSFKSSGSTMMLDRIYGRQAVRDAKRANGAAGRAQDDSVLGCCCSSFLGEAGALGSAGSERWTDRPGEMNSHVQSLLRGDSFTHGAFMTGGQPRLQRGDSSRGSGRWELQLEQDSPRDGSVSEPRTPRDSHGADSQSLVALSNAAETSRALEDGGSDGASPVPLGRERLRSRKESWKMWSMTRRRKANTTNSAYTLTDASRGMVNPKDMGSQKGRPTKPDADKVLFSAACYFADRLQTGSKYARSLAQQGEEPPPTFYSRDKDKARDKARDNKDEGDGGAGDSDGDGGADVGDGGGARVAEVEVPSEDAIFDFVSQLYDCNDFSPQCLVVALVYVERLFVQGRVPPLPSNWKAVLLSAVVLAAKVWDDTGSSNGEFAASTGAEFSVGDVNAMEKRLLALIDYNVTVTRQLYARLFFELSAMCEQEDETFSLKPQSVHEAERLERRSAELAEQEASNARARSYSIHHAKKGRLTPEPPSPPTAALALESLDDAESPRCTDKTR